MKKITLIDYDVGNTFSICSALDFLGYNFRISQLEKEILDSDAIILPGVGAYAQGISQLQKNALDETIKHFALTKQRPLLGICLGMQLLSTTSEEHGQHKGLNLIPGRVVKLTHDPLLHDTHVGWSSVIHAKPNSFLQSFQGKNFYFDHGYHFVLNSPDHLIGAVSYGSDITAAIQKDNICGVQFHPEKSQKNGLKMLRSFFREFNF